MSQQLPGLHANYVHLMYKTCFTQGIRQKTSALLDVRERLVCLYTERSPLICACILSGRRLGRDLLFVSREPHNVCARLTPHAEEAGRGP